MQQFGTLLSSVPVRPGVRPAGMLAPICVWWFQVILRPWARSLVTCLWEPQALRTVLWGLSVLQEGCPPPPRLRSSLDRSRASSSTTPPRGLPCRMPPACTPHHHSCLRGFPRPASPPPPSPLRCSSHSSHRCWRPRHSPRSCPRLSSSASLSLPPSPASPQFLLHSPPSRPSTSRCLGRRRHRLLSPRPSRRYSVGICSLVS